MQGRGSDPDRAREIMAQNPDEWAAFRPDVIGSVAVGHEGGAYTMAMYFTSEEAAREGERKQPPPQLKAQMEEMNKLNIGEPEFLDLRHPWLTLRSRRAAVTVRRPELSPGPSRPQAHRTIHPARQIARRHGPSARPKRRLRRVP